MTVCVELCKTLQVWGDNDLHCHKPDKTHSLHIGDVIQEVKFPFENNSSSKKVYIIIRETDLFVPFDYKTDKMEMLSPRVKTIRTTGMDNFICIVFTF